MASSTTIMAPSVLDDQLVFEDTEGVERITSFAEMGLKDGLLRRMYAGGFKKPSAIQQRAIMPILQGRHVIAQGLPRSGKTSMLAITVCQLVDTSIKAVQALILTHAKTPKLIAGMGKHIKIHPYCCVGSSQDIRKLQRGGFHVVCGTPERVCQLLADGHLKAAAVRLLLVDDYFEASTSYIPYLYSLLPPGVQVVFVFATRPSTLFGITREVMTDPVKILLKPDLIKLYFVPVETEDLKFDTLLGVLEVVTSGEVVIFCNTKQKVDWVTEKMRSNHFLASALHDDMLGSKRDAIMKEFRDGTTRVLILTDDLAPGFYVQLQQVSLVINYDLPSSRDHYSHRIGRRGVTVHLAERNDINILRDIKQCFRTHIRQLPINIC